MGHWSADGLQSEAWFRDGVTEFYCFELELLCCFKDVIGGLCVFAVADDGAVFVWCDLFTAVGAVACIADDNDWVV